MFKHNKYTNMAGSLAALLLASSSVFAGTPAQTIAASADEPAVSSINGKIDGIYGAVNQNYLRGTAGTISLPVGQRFGLQLDGLYARGFGTDILGYGGHFFTRNPSKGLLGLAVGGTHSTDFDDLIAGVEGELYFNRFTVGGFVGYNHYDTHVLSSFAPRVNTQRDFTTARLFAAVYPVDNLMISAEWQNRFGKNFYIVGLEYQTSLPGVALFVDGGVGDHNYRQVLGGIRIYFGGKKSLKDRHRKDDPENMGGIFGGTSGAGIASPAQPAAPRRGPV
jgi:hypothetical protein